MSQRARGGAGAAAKTIYYHSAIGTHRLHPRPLKNILYPYYRQYKPVYRARNPRTPVYYWPLIDKYPWHSHQKRFPKPKDITADLFSEFCRRDPRLRTLFETLHPLPLHGVNCLLWKTDGTIDTYETNRDSEQNPEEDEHVADTSKKLQVLNISGNYYIVDKHVRNNACYLIKHVDYKLRPFKAKVISDLYMRGRLVRANVSPVGSVRGEWKLSVPYRVHPSWEGNLITTDALCVKDITLYRKEFVEYTITESTH